MLLVGYFEGLDSQRGIAWRCADSLSLRHFLGIPLEDATPDPKTLSNTRRRLPKEVFDEVFQFVLCEAGRPSKPYDGFPLYAHPSSQWAKKIRNQFAYFGAWGRRINGKLVRVEGDGWKEALESYRSQAEAFHSGRKPRIPNVHGITIEECCDRFLTAKVRKMQSGEITHKSFAEYKLASDLVVVPCVLLARQLRRADISKQKIRRRIVTL